MKKERDNAKETIDLRSLIDDYRSHWYVFVITVVLCVGAAWAYTRLFPQKYGVEASILISQDEEKGQGSGGLKNVFGDMAGIFGSNGDVDDEVFLVSAHSTLRESLKRLEANREHYVKTGFLKKRFAYRDYPVDVYCNPAILDTLMPAITFKVKVNEEGEVSVKAKVKRETIAKVSDATFPVTLDTEYGQFIINSTKDFPKGEDVNTTITLKGYNTAADDMITKVAVNIVDKRSNAIQLFYASPDIIYAKDLLNTIIDTYNQRGIKDRNIKNRKTADFIDERLATLAAELKDSEASVESFKQSQNMADTGSDLLYEYTKKGTLEAEIVKSEAEVEIYKMLSDFVSSPENEYTLMPAAPATLDAGQAIASYNSMLLQRNEMMRNPRANAVAIQRLDDQLKAMRANMIVTLDKAKESAQTSVNEMQREIDRSDASISKMPYRERMQRDLYRQLRLKEELFVFLLQRREETSMTLANTTPKGIIVDEAFAYSEPLGLSPKLMLALAFVVGLISAPAYLYLRRLTRNKFSTKEELQDMTEVPVLGEVCLSHSDNHLVVRPGGSTSIAELFRLIRTNLQFIINDKDDQVILMTSTVSGEGKSFVSINLASSLALLGKKTLLVGMDIRAPKLADYLPIQPRVGLTEYLSRDGISLDDLILKAPIEPNLDIIVSGPVPPNPSELLLSTKVDDLFAELRKDYDYIIVDSAPVGMVSDSFALTRIADATIYVCRANYTTFRDIDFFNDIYVEGKLKKMSLVVNGTHIRKGYGYGYGYGDMQQEQSFWKRLFKRKQ